MADIRYPSFARDRGPGYWLKPRNLLASQRSLRLDYSNEWRYSFGEPRPVERSVAMRQVLAPKPDGSYRIVILGDTGEGDRSQYGLVPFIRALEPNMMIVNGDVAYPAGRTGSGNRDDDDFLVGFFEPYRNLGVPIWATPGNHEYYSPGKGREFYDIFCTRRFDDVWQRFGIPHRVEQPGMYWELLDAPAKFAVIGIDTGHAANLDGHKPFWQFWKKNPGPDTRQHEWLESRLRFAKSQGIRVLLLFHIPALVNKKHAEDHLHELHSLIAEYDCVKAVACGHEHSFQRYLPAQFRNYLRTDQKLEPASFPHYFVAGSSGAGLASTEFPRDGHECDVFPTAKEWKDFVSVREKAAGPLDNWVVGTLLERLARAGRDDKDAARYLSLLVVDVDGGASPKVTMKPGLMRNLNDLYAVGDDVVVSVTDLNAPMNEQAVRDCLVQPWAEL